jgi:hypothetical protein
MPQYQGVWTLEQQAQAQSNQQWVTDPNFKNTTLLLQADGTGSGSQNNTFLDGSTNNFFITRNGNTTQGSFSPFSQAPGYWSAYNSGSSSYCQLNNSNYSISTGDFTIEFWMFITSDKSTTAFATAPSNPNLTVAMTGGSAGARQPYLEYGGSGTSFGAFTNYLNTWVHVAFVRSSGTVTVYQNGVSVGTGSKSAAVGDTANLYLLRNSGDANQDLPGFISNFRICKAAVYTSTFTPNTTPFTTTSQGATSCQLLTFQNNRFIDNSVNASTVTPTVTSVQAFGPFAPALQWTPDVVGGSGYFDGTGDYLAVADTTSLEPGTGDFCFETWVYHTSASDGSSFDTYTFQTSGGLFVYRNLSNKIQVDSDGVVAILTSASNVPFNSWTHIAVTRSGTTLRIFINGVVDASVTNSTNIAGSGNITYGGRSDGSILDGYMSSTRFVKGSPVYTTTFTPPTAPLTAISGTSLLLNYTNAGIYDGKMGCVVETVSTAQVSTNPVKYGTGSIKFNGSTDRLTIRRSDLFDFGTGDFTIESWILFNSVSTIQAFATNYLNSTTGWGWQWRSDTGAWNFGYGDTGLISYTNTPVVGTWIHSAVCRSNNVLRMFVNGVLVSTVTNSTNMSGTTTDLTLGVNPFSGGVQYFNGYLDDFRITKGVGRYTATFTPPQQALPRQ